MNDPLYTQPLSEGFPLSESSEFSSWLCAFPPLRETASLVKVRESYFRERAFSQVKVVMAMALFAWIGAGVSWSLWWQRVYLPSRTEPSMRSLRNEVAVTLSEVRKLRIETSQTLHDLDDLQYETTATMQQLPLESWRIPPMQSNTSLCAWLLFPRSAAIDHPIYPFGFARPESFGIANNTGFQAELFLREPLEPHRSPFVIHLPNSDLSIIGRQFPFDLACSQECRSLSYCEVFPILPSILLPASHP